mmetsp:Transcript_42052/g.54164  ORF Transcript_42052/g.54164 Transcript_42052/m.54164 type:complete len:689 (+) Transcript_42052:114-2180(+)
MASIVPEGIDTKPFAQKRLTNDEFSELRAKRKSPTFRQVGELVKNQANVSNVLVDKLFDKRMEELVEKEQNTSSQRSSHNTAQPEALLSELRHTAPVTFFMRRLLYRTESALESVWNRVYALFFTVVLLLIVSVILYIGTLWLSGNEFRNLKGDADGYDDDGGSDESNGYDDDESYGEENVLIFAAWITWSFFVDPGFHTEVDPFRYKWGRMIGALISLLGILFFSFVLGFVVELMQSFIARVTEGKSSVIENDHYLILGYSEKCIAVIGELSLAMDSDGGGVIVVLADYPKKAEFDDLVDRHLNTLGLTNRSNVVFRPGSPLTTSNLLKVSPETSRAIIVLSDTRHDENHADAMVLRIVLSLKSILGQSAVDRRDMFIPPSSSSHHKTSSLSAQEIDMEERNKNMLRRHSQNRTAVKGGLNRKEALKKLSKKAKLNSSLNGRGHGGGGLQKQMSFLGSMFHPLVNQGGHGSGDGDGDDVVNAKKRLVQFKGHIIAELRDNDNTPIIKVSGGNIVELVVIHDIIGRMLAKSTIQPNIRRIYDDLLGFDGCEFYFASHPELAGKTFLEASMRLQGAVLVGVKREGEILLNPQSQTPSSHSFITQRRHSPSSHKSSQIPRHTNEFVLLRHDEIIVIAEDDSAYHVLDRPIFNETVNHIRPWPPAHGELTAMQAIEVIEAKEREKFAEKNC